MTRTKFLHGLDETISMLKTKKHRIEPMPLAEQLERAEVSLRLYYTDSGSLEFCLMWKAPGYLHEAAQIVDAVLACDVPNWIPFKQLIFVTDGRRHTARISYMRSLFNNQDTDATEPARLLTCFKSVFPKIELLPMRSDRGAQ